MHFVGWYTEYNNIHGMSTTKLAYLTFTSVLFHCPLFVSNMDAQAWYKIPVFTSLAPQHPSPQISTQLKGTPILVGMPRSYPLHNTNTPNGSPATFLLLPLAPTLTHTVYMHSLSSWTAWPWAWRNYNSFKTSRTTYPVTQFHCTSPMQIWTFPYPRWTYNGMDISMYSCGPKGELLTAVL